MSALAIPQRKVRRIASPRASAAHPLLETGYHLTQPEFHRRYEMLPQVKRAELIEGVVFMGSPLSVEHAKATVRIGCWLGGYAAETPGVDVAGECSVILDHDNEYQPDAQLFILPQWGGQTQLIDDKYLRGVPELVVEVALTSLAHDLHEKLSVYRRNGAREYLVWALPEAEFHWFNFESGEAERLAPARNGFLCSRVFPGLWLDAKAMVAGDLKKISAVVRRGLATADHANFVKKLSAAK